jgi:hypothetical protein
VTFSAQSQHLKATSRPEQSVGIFWVVGTRLILDSSPLSEAEPYGDNLTHSKSHIDCWTELQRVGVASLDVEYEEPPRGRVVFNMRTHRFTVYADRCILKKKAILNRIVRTMGLPVGEIGIVTDGHYRCYVCLAKMQGLSTATEH